MNENKDRYRIYHPLIIASVLVIGILIGAYLSVVTGAWLGRTEIGMGKKIFPLRVPEIGHFNKLNEIINYIDEYYVDTVDRSKLEDKAIDAIFQELDPHSAYIPPSDLQAVNESLEGNFEGIGIEFNIRNDSIVVISAISGGPSEALGIQAGDRIVMIDGDVVAGKGIVSKDVISKLRGKKGTKVTVQIFRRNTKDLLKYIITRDKIPVYSIDASYMVNDSIGYIKVNRFAETTYEEYLQAFDSLSKRGMTRMILDLRGNPGGYLNQAKDLADEFLSDGKVIVFTEGRARPKKIYKATSKGGFENKDMVVLIDEGSASASEIVSGAIQDNDRALIVGRRSFGKGLVQEQADMPDGSALRLTIARYYTPTGRCIQRSYEEGKEAYYNDITERFKDGEMQDKDSIHFPDSLKFTTPKGKVVYGGGGIMPDVYVPIDTSENTEYLTDLFINGVVSQFSFEYADKHRAELSKFADAKKYDKNFNIDDKLFNDFITYAEGNKVKKNPKEIKRSERLIKYQLKSQIARNIWNNDGYYLVIHHIDDTFQKGLELLEK